ncbi:DUF5658 family protein [Sutcliffiella horikoshii]|uniref:DUF5658 family protein n=1 Tax=Sutcliffiella horikoshii TaxID=79883 RepID=UPI0020403A4C|nr:DUF5658 family protein [Sutcliffiella horikoshii]MCM3617759.1 DUF5658 family protein [Sutcliffiella horikoshii]
MVRKLLIALLLLNIFDGAATFYGLQFRMIEEVNPLMKALYEESPFLFLFFKLGVSILLLFFIRKNLTLKSVTIKVVSATAVCGYGLVSLLHVYWIIFYIS